MRYLIYGGPGIGDFIFVLPLIKILHMNDPEAVVDVFCGAKKTSFEILERLTSVTTVDINKISYYALKEPLQTSKFVLDFLLRKRYDYEFLRHHPGHTHYPYLVEKFFCKKTVCSVIKGDSFKCDIPVFRDLNENIIDSYVNLARAIGYETSLDVNSEKFLDIESIRNLLPSLNILPIINQNKPSVSLLIGSNGPNKNWPYWYFDKLISLLLEKKINVIILGGQREKEILKSHPEIFQQNGIINMIGKCNILESLAILSMSDLVVGNDTGPMHCAWAMHIPCLSLWGPSNPLVFHLPRKNSSYIASNYECTLASRESINNDTPCVVCKNNMCMQVITVETVYDKVMSMLNELCPVKLRS